MPSENNNNRRTPTPFDDVNADKSGKGNAPQKPRKVPAGTAVGLAITAGALAVIFIAAIVYRMTPQPKSPYLVGGNTPRSVNGRPAATQPVTEVAVSQGRPLEEPPVSILANQSPEASADQRLKEERRIEERNIAEQRQLEDKKRAIERQIEDRQNDEKRRVEDKTLEDARILEDKKLIEARDLEDKRIADERRLEAEREEAAAKLAANQP